MTDYYTPGYPGKHSPYAGRQCGIFPALRQSGHEEAKLKYYRIPVNHARRAAHAATGNILPCPALALSKLTATVPPRCLSAGMGGTLPRNRDKQMWQISLILSLQPSLRALLSLFSSHVLRLGHWFKVPSSASQKGCVPRRSRRARLFAPPSSPQPQPYPRLKAPYYHLIFASFTCILSLVPDANL